MTGCSPLAVHREGDLAGLPSAGPFDLPVRGCADREGAVGLLRGRGQVPMAARRRGTGALVRRPGGAGAAAGQSGPVTELPDDLGDLGGGSHGDGTCRGRAGDGSVAVGSGVVDPEPGVHAHEQGCTGVERGHADRGGVEVHALDGLLGEGDRVHQDRGTRSARAGRPEPEAVADAGAEGRARLDALVDRPLVATLPDRVVGGRLRGDPLHEALALLGPHPELGRAGDLVALVGAHRACSATWSQSGWCPHPHRRRCRGGGGVPGVDVDGRTAVDPRRLVDVHAGAADISHG